MQGLVLEILSWPLPLRLLALALPALPNLWCIFHAFRKNFAAPAEKVVWICVGIFIPVIGGLIYLFWGRRRAAASGGNIRIK